VPGRRDLLARRGHKLIEILITFDYNSKTIHQAFRYVHLSWGVEVRLNLVGFIVTAVSMAAFGQGTDSQVRDLQAFNNNSVLVWTSTSIYKTTDQGQSWSEIRLANGISQFISHLNFSNESDGIVLVTDLANSTLRLGRTNDGGREWTFELVLIDPQLLSDADILNAKLIRTAVLPSFLLRIPLQTSSNFKGSLTFTSVDGRSWKFYSRSVEPNSGDEAKGAEQRSGNWSLRTEGTCERFKSVCFQESKILIDGKDVTPPQIQAAIEPEKSWLRSEADRTPMFALPPGGTTRISLNRGFDQCNAPTVAQMQAWWNNSPHYNANIYMSGRNRACSAQPNLNAAWVDQITAMGWGLIPTVVGYQSPCTASTTTVKLSYDPVVAEQQGRGEADIAVTDATNLGLTTGSILYYDMERYDPPNPDTLGCEPATRAFLKGWTDRMHELGYISGVYGSPFNAQNHWVNLPPASKMDVVWLARWDNVMSVWTYVSFPTFPTTEWANHQRIKQWQAPHNETWGGVTINIDGNVLDAPVAGIAIARNKRADFDGDGKTDISVWRPDTGVWYALTSSNGGFTATQFGLSTDVLAPGDYDGDGKTDQALFRPSDGTWHILTKAGFYNTRQFGTSGDIPVASDYNGDGKTDIAVFRPSNGIWYIANSDSQGTYSYIPFGSAGDKPVPADYDGDGKADVGVYRQNGSDQEWWIQRSTAGFFATVFGTSGDMAVDADYTGDGKADVAFFRPSTSTWYILRSEDLSYYAFPFGAAGDIPSPGDFDGDGKYDDAVFRPSTGTWYVQLSTGGFSIVAFGSNGDKPIPNAYLPQ
jgi:hypothetical protein